MNSDVELTLLSVGEIFGGNKLEVLKKYGTQSIITDLAVLTGGYWNNTDNDRVRTGHGLPIMMVMFMVLVAMVQDMHYLEIHVLILFAQL